MLLHFADESDRVRFGRERPTDANEQTSRREHGKFVLTFDGTVLSLGYFIF